MQATRVLLPLLAALAVSVLGGCGTLGPNAIKSGRENFNQVIHRKSSDQLLLNLVRLHHHEIPFFMNVEGVNVAMTVDAGVTAASTAICAPSGLTLGSVSGTMSVTENPSIQCKPLQGAALVADTVRQRPSSGCSIYRRSSAKTKRLRRYCSQSIAGSATS